MTRTVSAIIIHFNSADNTRHVIAALLEQCDHHLADIIIVENGTMPAPRDHIDKRIQIIRPDTPSSYATACNTGARHARGNYLLILNDDLDFTSDWLGPLVHIMQTDAAIGIIGPALTYRDGRFQLSWGDDPTIWRELHERRRQREARSDNGVAYRQRAEQSRTAHDVDWVTGAVMLCSRNAFDAVNGFDTGYPFYYEDIDICRRVRSAGFRVRYIPDVSVVHFLGGSGTAQHPTARSAFLYGRIRYYARHNGPISFLLVKLYVAVQATIRFFISRHQTTMSGVHLHPWWRIRFRPAGPISGSMQS
jgi:GT2 family glycosyltransferase